MSIFTGLVAPIAQQQIEHEEQKQEQIFPDNWTCAPVHRQVDDKHIEFAPTCCHEETVLQRIEEALSSVLDGINKGVVPTLSAFGESSVESCSWQLQLSLSNEADAQRFYRAFAVLERIQVRY
jgi:hypothetical protein